MIDSLKDTVSGLSSDDGGSAFNRAAASLTAAGIELITVHHGRKANGDNKKPTTIDDIYGSRWITSGQGSVFMIWGDVGGAYHDMYHLKPPKEKLDPLSLKCDHDSGEITSEERVDEFVVLQKQSPAGVSAGEAAERIYGDRERNNVERCRRRLDRLVNEGFARRDERTSSAGKAETLYVYGIPDTVPDAPDFISRAE